MLNVDFKGTIIIGYGENGMYMIYGYIASCTIETTPEHPFWVRDKGWTAAGEIEPGEELRSHDGQWIALDSKQLTDRIVTVDNIRVAEDHTYFVGSPMWGFTVWAHNACDFKISELMYEPNIKHSNYIKNSSKGSVGKAPTNGQLALEDSIRVKFSSQRRIGIDRINNEFIIFDQTRPGLPIFHGHVRTWDTLTNEMRSALVKSGMATLKGMIQ
jgi:hypothetical protein